MTYLGQPPRLEPGNADGIRLRIGRIGRDVPQDGLARWDSRGGRVSAEFVVPVGPMERAVAVRQQVLGLLDSDENVVPIMWEADPSINGVYRVLDADIVPDRAAYLVGSLRASLTLERVQGFAAPLLESRLSGYPRAGLESVFSRPWHGVPAAVKGYETNVLTPAQHVRRAEGGDVAVLFMGDFEYYDASPQYFLSSEDWYTGAATLTVNGAEIVGTEPVNAPDGWVLSNGIIRLIGQPGGWFRTERWNGSTWGDPGDWSFCRRVDYANIPALEPPHALTVLRNGPESVVIRLTTDAASNVSGYRFQVTVDIDLRRGALMADVILRTRGSYGWRVVPPLAASGTELHVDGISQGGFLVAFEGIATASLESGGSWTVGPVIPVNQANWGVGYHGTETDDTPDELIRQWAAHQRENTRVIIR